MSSDETGHVHVNIDDLPAPVPQPGITDPLGTLLNGRPIDPQERFAALRSVWRLSEQLRLVVAVWLAEADERQEWLLLGYERFEQYAAEIGIPPSTARKLRLVGRVFGRRLLDVSPVDRAQMGTE